jgi:hypothetical protein
VRRRSNDHELNCNQRSTCEACMLLHLCMHSSEHPISNTCLLASVQCSKQNTTPITNITRPRSNTFPGQPTQHQNNGRDTALDKQSDT